MTTSNIGADYPNWIITDLRFPNELEAIKQRKGITIRINRPDYYFNKEEKRIIPTSKEYVNVDINPHKSEIALDNAKFDYIVENDSDITSLIEKVKNILIKEKIICKK